MKTNAFLGKIIIDSIIKFLQRLTSKTIMINPAQICHTPAMIQVGKGDNTTITPNIMAPGKNKISQTNKEMDVEYTWIYDRGNTFINLGCYFPCRLLVSSCIQ